MRACCVIVCVGLCGWVLGAFALHLLCMHVLHIRADRVGMPFSDAKCMQPACARKTVHSDALFRPGVHFFACYVA